MRQGRTELLNMVFLQKALSTGVVTSPNHPHDYPNGLNKTETIQVEEGLALRLEFAAIDIQYNGDSPCINWDYLRIRDNDGTILMKEKCGSVLPPNITSLTNIVHIDFHTDSDTTRTGWKITWSAVKPGAA